MPNVAAIDYDGTLSQWGEHKLLPGASQYVRRLQDAGWYVFVYTGNPDHKGISDTLSASGLDLEIVRKPHQLIGSGARIIDDQAITFEGNWIDMAVEWHRPWWDRG